MLPSIKKNYAQELLIEGKNKRTDFRSSWGKKGDYLKNPHNPFCNFNKEEMQCEDTFI